MDGLQKAPSPTLPIPPKEPKEPSPPHTESPTSSAMSSPPSSLSRNGSPLLSSIQLGEIPAQNKSEPSNQIVLCQPPSSSLSQGNNDRKLFSKESCPFLAVLPPEMHLKIFECLNPIDGVCLSLANKYLYIISSTRLPSLLKASPLSIGSPYSDWPVIRVSGCKHCCPVLYYPAHCELHYHLRSFIPRHLTYCSGLCGKYTMHERSIASDAKLWCGSCNGNYRKRYERGRRMIDMSRPGEAQARLRKWYDWNVRD